MRFALMTGVQTCALPICLGNHGFWLRRFCRRDADQFQSTEGEHDDRQRQQHAAEAVGEEATVRPQVADACLLAPLATDQQEQPEQDHRSEEHTSELQSLMRISYAVVCLKKKNTQK